ncbi:UvrABC system protein C [Sulfuriferula plumbiphila]|uniref:UvrABC system protein C n=1 Tax=Sulfuriferula plumbiphila TaxID=171865 RepID=A0A512L9A5_9PROT|nr:excinuclease ABC subunit UvrC [Sulfuriferula plumbiphila]BBP05067.1 UvrABC system protein C [Sulfuriferula plumbiphila]GEP30721.1 UvrABC system protein C [Sulfuriferula plumbiphila]
MKTEVFDSKAFLATLPSLPGVYRMLGQGGEVLYVGKARDLKKRVASYFQKNDQSPRIRLMVAKIASVEITVTRSESEALVLENNLIKALSPRYNILFRDDKSYPYLMLSGHRYPRLAYFRGTPQRQDRCFGPFPNSHAVRDSIQILQKVFRLRTCEDSVFNHRSRPCLLHQIKRCTAPCVDLICAEDYAADVKNAALFLDGKENEVLQAITEKMQHAAAAMRYEEAALYRDQIKSLTAVREKQFVSSHSSVDVDVVAVVAEHGLLCVNLLMIRGGRHLGDKTLFPQNAQDVAPEEAMQAFLAQHYLNRTIPPQIIVSEPVDVDAFAAVFSEQAGRKVSIQINPIGERRSWLAMTQGNARIAITRQLAQKATQQARLTALQEALALPGLQRIECFDISHTMGEATVASCVVYDKGTMQNGEYRRYNISGITPGDDYAAMRDALTRRYTKIQQTEARRPDLILIDGGTGQLHIASEVMAELGITDIELIGVAKGIERKAGMEQLITTDGRATRLPGDHPGLHLIQHIRDEAHRFAITGHRARRGKARTHSALEDIGGIGPKRRQKLLENFGGLRGLQNAGVEEIARIEGISRALAEKIYRELH